MFRNEQAHRMKHIFVSLVTECCNAQRIVLEFLVNYSSDELIVQYQMCHRILHFEID